MLFAQARLRADRGARGDRGAKTAPTSYNAGSVSDERVFELSRRLAEKQREIDALRAQQAGFAASPGGRLVTVLSLVRGLVLFQPEARYRLLTILRRRRRQLVHRWRTRRRTAGGQQALPDNTDLYARWRDTNEPDSVQLEAQRRIAHGWAGRPLVSIVSPVFAPPAEALDDTIASVLAQTYDRWELILVLAGPQPDAVTTIARAASARDARIRLVTLASNLGIAANTNAGISGARGEFVAFLDHDDLLSPDTLFEVVRLIRADPTLDVVTFDEDKITADGRTRVDPLFKPSCASPEHLLSFNDRMHSVVRRSRIEEIGGLAGGVDGAQDWDLGLRLFEAGATSRHIPRVLYHWRMVPGSAAGDAMAKPWAFDAQRAALQRHLERLGLEEPAVDHPQIGVVRVTWKPSDARVSIIIPTRDRARLLETCLRSIREKTARGKYEILVIDTGSTEDATRHLYASLASDPVIRLLRDDAPFNFSRINNLGAREATGEVLVFLNNDIEVIDGDWLDELVRWAGRRDVGCVGPKLLYPDGSLQHAGIVAGMGGHGSHVYQGGPGRHTWGVFGSVDFYRNYLMLGGACLAVRRSVFEELGGFDEHYTLCYSDLELCLKAAEAGYRNVYTPFATLYHHEGGTRGLHFPPADVLRASIRLFPVVVQGDPYYNRNLSFQERLPTVAPADMPSARADLIRHIAGMFEVETDVRRALDDELAGRTAVWREYARLVRGSLPAVAGGTPAEGAYRLLFVSHDLSRSGAPMVVLHLARALARLGHAVTVLSPTEGRLREDLEEAGANVIVSPLALEAPYAMAEVFERFDAILPNTVLAWRVVIAAHALGKPVLWLVQESYFGLTYVRGDAGSIQALAVADEVVFPSAQTLAMYRELDAGNMSAERYGLDPPAPPAGVRPSLRPGVCHLVALGSLEPRKGQDVLLTAFRKLPAHVRDHTELHLLGRFLDQAFVETLRGVAGSMPVRFHGEVSPAEALAYVAAADGLVCSSRDETGPLAVMEAMGLGTPVISTSVGAVPELLEHGVTGLVVEPGEVPPLRAALERFVTDADLRKRMSAAARRVFDERLGSERYGRAMAARIERAVAGRAARQRPALTRNSGPRATWDSPA